MDNFIYINACKTTLANEITNAQTTIQVSNPGRFPSSIPLGQILVLTLHPDGLPSTQEIVHCTAISGDVLTVVRGAQSTAATAWPEGTAVGAYLTADMLDQIADDVRGHAGSGGSAHAVATTLAAGFMAAADKTKLNGVEAGATKYVHPANHPPAVIAQDASNRFATDAEKANWNAAKNHADSAHAPSNAQKNSDITKAEIEAKVGACLPITGGTLTGSITIQSGAPTISLVDTDNADRHIHCNSNLIGFLNSGGGWSFYSKDDGQNVSPNSMVIGASTHSTDGNVYMPWAGDWLSNVLATKLTKNMGFNNIGSYCLCVRVSTTEILQADGYYDGSTLMPAGLHKNDSGTGAELAAWGGGLPGGWRCCGHYPGTSNRMKMSLFQRVW